MITRLPHGLFALLTLIPGLVLGAEEKPVPGIEPLGAAQLGQVLLALVAVVLLIVGMAWLLRRMNQFTGAGNNVVRVLGGISMGQRERVVVVQVGETQLVLGVAPGRINTLHVMDQPLQVESTRNESFAERLASAMAKRES